MTTTAHEQSPLMLDYANCLASRVGDAHGLTASEFEAGRERMRDLTAQLADMQGRGEIRWRGLPVDPMRRRHLEAIRQTVENVHRHFESRHGGPPRHLIVLGIGGSALGNIAIQTALRPHTWNALPDERRGGPCLHVLDNVDPRLIRDTLEFVRQTDPGLQRTVVNVISKSGETAETAAQFLLFREILKTTVGERWARHLIATTDEKSGTMRKIVDEEGYASLPVPDGVGGRFSVLSPVGLFSAAMCGIDIEAMLDGARAMDQRCKDADYRKNPAAMLAFLLITLMQKKGKWGHVLMPYCNGLYGFADWYRQLWAESLGKRYDRAGKEVFVGATPIKALGATDQHSQIQLYREGPNDKVVGFLEVADFGGDHEIPGTLPNDAISYLFGARFRELLNAEKRATEFALVESRRPNFTIRFPAVTAHSVGQFIQLWQVATAYAGLLLDIDAYDQPAVETGKKATFGLMGREGYEDWQQKVKDALAETEYVM